MSSINFKSKPTSIKTFRNKILLKLVICLSKIDFPSWKTLLTFSNSEFMKHLMSQNNIVLNMPTKYKGNLVRPNKIGQKDPKLLNNNFTNNFIVSAAELIGLS
ncbi:hypothetical protein ACOSQ4_013100 [Xanthoceras sorbifolium]